MSKSVTISGTTYTLNQQSDDPPWGEEISDLLQALVDVANNSVGTGDIPNTSFNSLALTATNLPVTNLIFDPSVVRSAVIDYSISRITSTAEENECGTMYITYNTLAGTWSLNQNYVGSSGVSFTIGNDGQINYTSLTMAGSGYSSKMRFKAQAFTIT